MFDDEYGKTLLQPLRGEPTGPSAVDVPRAMRDGRRMRNRRWWSTGLIAILGAGLLTGGLLLAPAQHHEAKPILPPDPPVPASCTAAALPAGKYSSAEVDGGDTTGRWQFGLSNPVAGAADQRLLVWHDGKLAAEAEVPGVDVALSDMNSSGVGVGRGRDHGVELPYVYRDGKIGLLKGGPGRANAINNAGVIIGALGEGTDSFAVRWQSADAEPERLPMPGKGIHSQAVAISPDGTIAGYVSYIAAGDQLKPGAQPGESYVWAPDGTIHLLEAPASDQDKSPMTGAVTFRNGWLYVRQNVDESSNPDFPRTTSRLYRLDLASGVWQKIKVNDYEVQIPSPPTENWIRFLSSAPKVLVGPRVLDVPLSKPIGDPEIDSAMVTSMSNDAHILAGYVIAGETDPTQPFRPVIWRCK